MLPSPGITAIRAGTTHAIGYPALLSGCVTGATSRGANGTQPERNRTRPESAAAVHARSWRNRSTMKASTVSDLSGPGDDQRRDGFAGGGAARRLAGRDRELDRLAGILHAADGTSPAVASVGGPGS